MPTKTRHPHPFRSKAMFDTAKRYSAMEARDFDREAKRLHRELRDGKNRAPVTLRKARMLLAAKKWPMSMYND